MSQTFLPILYHNFAFLGCCVLHFWGVAFFILASIATNMPIAEAAKLPLEFFEFLLVEDPHQMPLFHERAVGLDDEEVRDASTVQIKWVAALRFHDRELDVMFLRPCEL